MHKPTANRTFWEKQHVNDIDLRGLGAGAEEGEDAQITAVPHFTWANRGISPMPLCL
jgi:hypothetical protein